MKKYIKPKFTVIKFSLGNQLLAGSDPNSEVDDENQTDNVDIKAQTFRIFDDSFEDISSSEESGCATTTNTIEVW